MTELPADENDGLEPDTPRVFLSYSRKDRERAQSIADVLRERHFGVYKDTDDILPTEEWKGRLEELIREADTIVFLMSPASVASEVCAWEVEYATGLNKRIAPIVISDVETTEIPPLLARLNFIFCTERDRFHDAVDSLVSALNTNIDWIREHTRLAGLARRWRDSDKSRRLLLSGQDIGNAELWRDTRPREAPAVLPVQSDYIAASRAASARRQKMVAGLSLAGLAVALGLATFALIQRETAVENEARALVSEQQARENERRANEARSAAELARSQAETERNTAQVNQSRMLAGNTETAITDGRSMDGILIALEGLPDRRSIDPLRKNRPLVDELLLSLNEAVQENRERAVLISGNDLVRFSLTPDQRILAAHYGGEGRLVIFDLWRRTILRDVKDTALRGQTRPPLIADNGTVVMMPGHDGNVWFVPLEQEKTVEKLKFDGRPLVGAILSETGTVVAATNQGHVYSRGRDGSNPMKVVRAQTIVPHPDGRRFAAINNGFIGILDIDTRKILRQTGQQLKGPLKAADRLLFSPDGSYLVAVSEHRVWVLDGETAAYLYLPADSPQSIWGVGFNIRGDMLWVTDSAGNVDVHRLSDQTRYASFNLQGDLATHVSLTPADDRVYLSTGAGDIQVRSLPDGMLLHRSAGHKGHALQLALLSDGRSAISSSEDGTIRLWTFPDETKEPIAPIEGYAGDPVYAPDGQIVGLSETGIFDIASGRRLAPGWSDAGAWRFVRFTQDGRVLAMPRNPDTGDSPDACLLTVDPGLSGPCMFGHDMGNIWTADMDPHGRTIALHAVMDGDSSIVTFDAETSREVGRLRFKPLDQKGGSFSDPAVSLDGGQILVIRNQYEVVTYDRDLMNETGRVGSSLQFPTIQFFPDRSRILFVSDEDKAAEVVDIATGKQVARFEVDRPARAEAHFSPSGRYVLMKTVIGTFRIHESETGAAIGEPEIMGPDPMRGPVFSADEKFMLVSSGATTVAFDLSENQLIAEYKLDFGDAYPVVFAKAFVPEEMAVVAWSWDGPKKWPFISDPHRFISDVQNNVTRCLSPELRRASFLPAQPPLWCITGPGREEETDPGQWRPLWPYQSEQWRDWLEAINRGENPQQPE